jgi:hypothetical protein
MTGQSSDPVTHDELEKEITIRRKLFKNLTLRIASLEALIAQMQLGGTVKIPAVRIPGDATQKVVSDEELKKELSLKTN